MATAPVGGLHILLNLAELDADEAERDRLCAAIAKLAPQSPLFTSVPAIAGEVANLATVYTAYKTATGVAGASAKQARIDAKSADSARNTCNRSLSRLRNMTENNALDTSTLAGMGFTAYEGPPAAPSMDAPAQIDQRPGKKGSGKSTASVHETGGTRRHYAAEGSTDGGVTFTGLPGNGKSRKLTGKSGTSMLVRFALVRGQLMSPWSQPVVVTFP